MPSTNSMRELRASCGAVGARATQECAPGLDVLPGPVARHVRNGH